MLKSMADGVSSPQSPQPPARHRPIVKLGAGGMGDVFLSAIGGAAGSMRLAVVKRVKPEFWENPEFRKMFEAEARLAARLQHRNCVQVVDVDHDNDGVLFIAMEYIEGQALSRIWSRAGITAMPITLGVWVLREALNGVHYAHELRDFNGELLNIVHRDVTPANIMLSYNGDVKLIDFGIAKSLNAAEETRVGLIKGKAAFLAPEQVSTSLKVDRRVDIYGLGTILWAMIAGERMWKGTDPVNIIGELAKGAVPPLPEGGDPELRAICEKATARKADDRFATAEEMRDALDEWLAKQEDRPTAAALGKWLRERFAADREKVQAIIKGELANVRLDDPTPNLAVPTLQVTASEVEAVSLTQQERRHWLVAGTGGIMIAGAIGITLAVLGYFGGFSDSSTQSAKAPTPPAVAPAPPEAEAPPEPRRLRVSVTPPDAVVHLDGEKLQVGGIDWNVLDPGRGYELRVTREGYRPHVERIPEDGSVLLAVRLEREAPPEPTAETRRQASASRAAMAARRRATAQMTQAPEQTSMTQAQPASSIFGNPYGARRGPRPNADILADPYGSGQ